MTSPPASTEPEWPEWYDVAKDDSLRQGDIFRDIMAYWPAYLSNTTAPGPGSQIEFDGALGSYIIASASCDVDQAGYPYVLLHRVIPATPENLRTSVGAESERKLEVLRQGLVPSQHLLPSSTVIDPAFPLSIVQHKIHTLLPIEYLRACARGPRLRLRHPFRERFGIWVGANFSRVGLETGDDMAKFVKSIHPIHVVNAQDD